MPIQILHLLNTDTNAIHSPPSLSKQTVMNMETGLPAGDLDAATREKAEARYYSFYQFTADPDPEAQGTANFN